MRGGVVQELRRRGLVHGMTGDKLPSNLHVYAGFDPTAPSLHLGNLLVLNALTHFHRHGHRVTCLVGSATACIGDPSGKTSARVQLERDTVLSNSKGIRAEIQRLLPGAAVVDNLDWYAGMTVTEYLSGIAPYHRLQSMLAKDSVSSRLDAHSSLSLSEFSYQTLQAHDFYHLSQASGVNLQVGGSDQWGNITAGIEYSHRRQSDVHLAGLTLPLLVSDTGVKFGKSEGNALPLTGGSPYALYQYLVNTADTQVLEYLKLLTLDIELDTLDTLDVSATALEARTPHTLLAHSLVKRLYGDKAAYLCKYASGLLFAKHHMPEALDYPVEELAEVAGLALLPTGETLADTLLSARVCTSKSQCSRLVRDGGVYLDGDRVTDMGIVTPDSALAVLRIGKKKHILLSNTVM